MSLQSKNSYSTSLESKPNGMTWNEATMTWDEATFTWDQPALVTTEQSKNSYSLSLQTK